MPGPEAARAASASASASASAFASASTLGRRVLRAAPWLGILLITGIVQFIRDAPWDGVIFLSVATVLAVDVVWPLSSWRRPVVRKLVVWLVVAAAAVLLVLMPRHSVGEGIVAVAIGVTVLVFAWPDRPAPARVADERTIRRTAVLWSITALAVCGWELVSFVLGRTMPGGVIEHPAISDLINPALDLGWGHALFAAAWLAFGALLVVPWRRRAG